MAIARLLLVTFLACGTVIADDRRAEVNYMLHCQGCHLPEAEGFDGKVPPMKNFVGYFLHSPEGRDFVIRVPGVSRSALNDAELAELMNWLLVTYSAEQLPHKFLPYTADEVAKLRVDPEPNPESTRNIILATLADDYPAVAAELE
jgi:hypothetical protein